VSKNEAVRRMLCGSEARRIDSQPGAKSMLLPKRQPSDRWTLAELETLFVQIIREAPDVNIVGRTYSAGSRMDRFDS
jgi:hypothetical protein